MRGFISSKNEIENHPYFHMHDTEFFKIALEAIISIWMAQEGIQLLKTLQINEICPNFWNQNFFGCPKILSYGDMSLKLEKWMKLEDGS